MPSHTLRIFVKDKKLFFFSILKLGVLTSMQKTTVILTAMLQEQGHRFVFEVISFTLLCAELN